jgi:hypothetical protein
MLANNYSWDFFLAHASTDKKLAEALYALLEPHAKTFLDSRSIQPGDTWAVALLKALETTRIVVVLITPAVSAATGTVTTAGADAYYLMDEIARAIKLTRADKNRRLIPVFVVEDLNTRLSAPYGLERNQSITVSPTELPHLAEQLLRVLERARASSVGGEQKAPVASESPPTNRDAATPLSQNAHQQAQPDTKATQTPVGQQPRHAPQAETIAEQRPPRSRSVPKVLGALGLMFCGLGILYQGSSKQAPQRSPPASVTPRVPESPFIAGTGEEALVEARRRNRVRLLQSDETGRSATLLPTGVLGFVAANSMPNLNQAVLQPLQNQDSIEVHKTSTGSLHLVGFIKQGDSQFVLSGKSATVALSPRQSAPFQTVVSLPIDRVRSTRITDTQGERLLEVRLRASTASK